MNKNLSLTINLENAAFADYPAREVADILQKLINKIDSGGLNNYVLLDSDGNGVGKVTLT